MAYMDFNKVIERLRKERKLFHSEDDLQFAISLIIKEIFSNFQIRLEKPKTIKMKTRDGKYTNKRAPIDIVISNADGSLIIPVELKYKTKKLQTENNNESYNLTEHGAKDIGRFSFRKDIYRIEQFIHDNKNSKYGFVLIITNDSGYYSTDTTTKKVLDSNFSFHDEATIEKEDKSWNYDCINKNKYEFISSENKWKYKNSQKSHWSCTGEKFYLLNLKNEYKIKWEEYSKVNKSEFKFCLITVNS